MVRQMLFQGDSRAIWHSILCVLVLIMTEVCFVISSSNCLQNDTIIWGQFLQNSTFKEVVPSTIYSCAAACYGYSICKSFNFDTASKTCFLNSANEILTPILMKENPRFVYSNIRLWPESIAGPCEGHTCTVRCIVVTRKNAFFCESGPASHVTSDMTTQESVLQQSTHTTPSHAPVYEPVFKDEKVSWQDAVSECSDEQGSLFIVNTTERSDTIKELLKQEANGDHAWVGASYDDQSSRWMWEDGQEMLYPTQDLLEGDDDCLSVKYEGDDKPLHWHKKKCTDNLKFLCAI